MNLTKIKEKLIHLFFFVTGILAVVILLGIFYSIPIIPSGVRHLWRYAKIKDIPGSKTLLEAFAWAVVITLIPLLTTEVINWPAVIVTFFVVLSMAFVRTAFFDVFQVQGDLIVGVETLYYGEYSGNPADFSLKDQLNNFVKKNHVQVVSGNKYTIYHGLLK